MKAFLLPVSLLIVLIKICLYIFIFYTSWRRVEKMTKFSENTPRSIFNRALHKSHMRTTKMSAVVLAVFLGCWMPFNIYLWCEYYGKKKINQATILIVFQVLLLNSVLNPLIYCFGLELFKKELKLIIFCRKSVNEGNSSSNTVGNSRPVIHTLHRGISNSSLVTWINRIKPEDLKSRSSFCKRFSLKTHPG